MLEQGIWDITCSSYDKIPPFGSQVLRDELCMRLGMPVEQLLPEFAAAFPLCTTAMISTWLQPILILKHVVDTWIGNIALEGVSSNIFFKLRPTFHRVEGMEFDQYKAMLPTRWKELYRWFDSFGITKDSVITGGWLNTPFDHASRLDLEEYRLRFGGKKAEIRDFAERIDSDKLRCWMVTDAGDALWLDEQRCDHKVYHVKNGQYDDCAILPDPENTLDAYLAHVVSGGAPNAFDFRA
jgi:hypothetical protein